MIKPEYWFTFADAASADPPGRNCQHPIKAISLPKPCRLYLWGFWMYTCSLVSAARTKLQVLVIFIAGIFFASPSMGADCTPENITLETQEDVDNFQFNHGPGCDAVTGNLTVSGLSGGGILNLNGLSELNHVGGWMELSHTDALIDLDGLAGLASLGGNLLVHRNLALRNVDGLSGLTEINGDAQITINRELESISGFSGITTINGSFLLNSNTMLQDLTGLENLVQVGQDLSISGSDFLADLGPLSGISELGGGLAISFLPALTGLDGIPEQPVIDGNLTVYGNRMLNDISALSNMHTVRGSLTIRDNDALENVAGLSNLRGVDGDLNITENAALANLAGLSRLTSIDGSLDISRNAGLISFEGLNALTDIGLDLTISANEALTNLDALSGISQVRRLSFFDNISVADLRGLSSLRVVLDRLAISYNGLIDLNGLQNLTVVGGDMEVSSNSDLTSFSGLTGLEKIDGGLQIRFNPSLVSLEGLSNLGSIGKGLSLVSNNNLLELGGLTSLADVGETLDISRNEQLANLDSLRELQRIGRGLSIESNSNLVSVNGLISLTFVGLDVYILDNPKLESCAGLIPLLDGLDDAPAGPGPGPGGVPDIGVDYVIEDNADSCNSFEAVLETETRATFSVSTSYSDGNPAALDVSLDCAGTTLVSPANTEAAGTQPAQFEVRRYIPEFQPACSATLSSVHIGYTSNESDCQDVTLTDETTQGCTVFLQQDPIPFRVSTWFADNNPAAVTVSLECDSGSVRIVDSTASIQDDAEFSVTNIPYSGTRCSANETLPAGYVQTESTCGNVGISPGEGNTCRFTNAPTGPPSSESDPTALTGSWYDPETSGEGFVFHTVNESQAVGYFYGYDANGGRLWLVGTSGGPFEWGIPILFEAQIAEGGTFNDIQPESIVRSDWGGFVVTLWNCENATADIFGDEGEKQLQLERIATVAGTKCSGDEVIHDTDFVTGSWYEPETSGQGFSIHKISEDRGVVYFYGFDRNGENLWLLGVWESALEFGIELTIELDQTSGGYFGPFDPDDLMIEPWGTLRMRIDDCESGIAIMDGLDGSQQLDIQLLAGSLGLDCPPR